jgi:adenosine deaminase
MNVRPLPLTGPAVEPALVELPKCNLHSHLEGSIRPATWFELAQEAGLDQALAQAPTPEAAAGAMQVDGSERSLVDYLAKISFSYPVLQNAAALTRTAYEAAEDAANDGVVYFELRAGPALHTRPALGLEEVIDSLLVGLHKAEARYGMVCRLIVAALRHQPPETSVRLAHAALSFKGHGVVGFDLAGDEEGYPAQLHAEAFRVARQGGMNITVHAGEAAGADNVRYAVEELGATRIGHGVRSVESPAVLRMLQEQTILLEICPTSNLHTRAVTRLASHPVRRLYELDIPISIGDDDPITSRTRVSNELTLLLDNFGFSYQELHHIQQMGLEAAFLEDEGQRQALIGRLNQGWSRIK